MIHYSRIKYAAPDCVDNTFNLEREDDAAHVNWGGAWHMPTLADWRELFDSDNCACSWFEYAGTPGYKIQSIGSYCAWIAKFNKNSKSIYEEIRPVGCLVRPVRYTTF